MAMKLLRPKKGMKLLRPKGVLQMFRSQNIYFGIGEVSGTHSPASSRLHFQEIKRRRTEERSLGQQDYTRRFISFPYSDDDSECVLLTVNEICDRIATVGVAVNLITYLIQKLNFPIVKASNILTNFGGTSSFMPLIDALIADSFAGRFWTILVGSIFYQLGLVSITISAILPQLRPPPCPTQKNCQEASSLQLWVLYLSLFFLLIGAGGIRPNVITFAADQFDKIKSKVEARSWNFFNWYFFSMSLSSLMSLTVVVYVQENVGWVWEFQPLSWLSLQKIKPGGSPFVRLAQVIVAAWKKRKEVAPEDLGKLYENRELDALISSTGSLLHTDQFKWLDRAAIVTEDDAKEQNSPNLWRLSTVHQVEELKSIIRVLPIWASGILLAASESNSGNFIILQARSMDRHFSHSSSFQIPPASLSIFSILIILIGLVLYDRLFVPIARLFTQSFRHHMLTENGHRHHASHSC
ncbi:hypothetical protein ACSBR2_020297 [Camellia fascicularis]